MKRTFILGDTHGRFKEFFELVERHSLKDFNLIHVGDIGVGFECHKEEWLKGINKRFNEKEINFYGIRGNHDDPAYFDGSVKLSNLSLLPDKSILELNGENYLMYGGGISIDRFWRTKNETFWENEGSSDFDESEITKFKKIDYVISHNCPRSAFPLPREGNKLFLMDYSPKDLNLVKDVSADLNKLDKLESCLIKNFEVKKWFYGHYHVYSKKEIGKIKYQCLNVSELVLNE